MRIAYVNANYHPHHTGGGHVHMEQFVRNATTLGHEIWAYSNAAYPEAKKIPTGHLDHIRTMRSMDVLYIRLEGRFPQICTWSLPPRRWLYSFPLVVWEFNTLPEELNPNTDENESTTDSSSNFKKYSPGCDLAICVSPALNAIVSQELRIKKVVTIPNGSDPALFKPDAPVAERMAPFLGKFNVAWVGSLKETWNDLNLLKDAARQIWDGDSKMEINFHIIGAGMSGIMMDMPPNVYYWGAEYYSRLPKWLAGMDVGLSLYHPSSATLGSPLKIFDYMASGMTVISSTHPIAEEILRDLKQLDLLIPFGDSNILVNAIIKLSKDRERVRQLGLAGRQLVIERYNWRRSVQDTMNEIEAILRNKRSGSRR